ncbi:MAG: hypothetical protein DRP49_06925 [Spirochaetes bacterium]|nr:MAG: hypothetical protein DRP49_06925 [Spirochaetota bacterium]
METKALKCVTADKDNIGDYGTLVFTDNKTPGYESKEFSFWNRLGEMALSETASVCLVESHKTDRLTSSVFERHLNTSETLIPTDDIVIVIALPGKNGNKEPDWDTVKAFRIKKGDAIILSKEVWHYAPMAVNGTVKTFVVFNTNTPEKDNVSLDSQELYSFIYEVEL